jgi:hypothetical protein
MLFLPAAKAMGSMRMAAMVRFGYTNRFIFN